MMKLWFSVEVDVCLMLHIEAGVQTFIFCTDQWFLKQIVFQQVIVQS
jgi:hypothetical protein